MQLKQRWKSYTAHSILGVDIHPSSIRMVEIAGTKNAFKITTFASVPLSPDAIVDNLITDKASITQGVLHLLSSYPFNSRRAVIALPDSLLINKHVQIKDTFTLEEQEEWVLCEAEKHIPCFAEEISVDFHVLSPSDKKTGLLDVQFVATRLLHIETRVSALLEAGLVTEVVEVASHALTRAEQSDTVQPSQFMLACGLAMRGLN